MEFKLTKINDNKLVNTYEIKIEYTHADGNQDGMTYDNYFLKNADLDKLEKYITEFNKLSKAIDNNRSHDVALPRELTSEKVDIGEGMVIPLKYDMYDSEDGRFADMSILKITFYDEDGYKFDVSYS